MYEYGEFDADLVIYPSPILLDTCPTCMVRFVSRLGRRLCPYCYPWPDWQACEHIGYVQAHALLDQAIGRVFAHGV